MPPGRRQQSLAIPSAGCILERDGGSSARSSINVEHLEMWSCRRQPDIRYGFVPRNSTLIGSEAAQPRHDIEPLQADVAGARGAQHVGEDLGKGLAFDV